MLSPTSSKHAHAVPEILEIKGTHHKSCNFEPSLSCRQSTLLTATIKTMYDNRMDNQSAALAEAIRRRQGMPPSSAGIAGGAPQANANTPANPMASQGMTPQQPTPQGSAAVGVHPPAPTAENPLVGAQNMMNRSAPDEATIIIKSFADRLKKLPTAGQPLEMI